MNVLIASGAAYALSRGLGYAYSRLLVNQNWGRGDNPYLIFSIARRVVNGLASVGRTTYFPPAIKTLLSFLLASVYDSVWIAIPLFSLFVMPCGVLTEMAVILGLSVGIEIARKWGEKIMEEMGCQTPPFFCTSYPVENVYAHIAFKALMLLPALFLTWLPAYASFPFFLMHWTGLAIVSAEVFITINLFANLCVYLDNLEVFIENYFQRGGSTAPAPDSICPILGGPMTDPVRLRCGHFVEREAFIKWIRLSGAASPHLPKTCPNPSCRERILTREQWEEDAPARRAREEARRAG